MSELIRTYTIEIGKVYNGDKECKNPIVELAGKQHIAVNCIDPEGCLYTVQLGPNDQEPCLKFLVSCGECHSCGTKVIEKCFCDSIDDCDECEICKNGFCEPTCPDGICKEGKCVECDEDNPCECNKICVNGKCVCPVGTELNENGCCDECIIPATDADLFPPSGCGVCEECVDKGGYTVCEPKECNCDINGRCGPKGECVECLNSGHCPPNEVCGTNCECVCAPGYTRVNGVCVPSECPNGDADCEECEICSNNKCIPVQCPSGKVPVVINGNCECVQECNCEKPDCSSKFNYCGESSVPGKCACIPCDGNCDTGCEDPCICDEDLNKCKYNPCFGECESGLDCGPGCGCKDGLCIPCDSLDCTTDECAEALGCKCSAARKCQKDPGCESKPCSVAADCGEGCTCEDGTCESCSNFSCLTGECSQKDGCICDGGVCKGDGGGGCKDEVTIEKNDDSCEITGKLIKDNCCQCPALTLDVKVKDAKDSGPNKVVTYIAEVRKGAYDGVSVESTPRVDNFENDNIAENETPLSGTIRLTATINYDILNGKDYRGTSTEDLPVIRKAYNSSENTAEKTFVLSFPKIGTRTVSGQTASVVTSVDVKFTLDTKMTFENNCIYPSGTEIGTFKITSNAGAVQAPIASTIKSPECRKPFFKWTKFENGDTTGDVFRKLYVEGAGTYIDTFGGDDGAESCAEYTFEPDCNCDDPASKYIVFCNPSEFPKPTLTECGKRYDFTLPATCEANYEKQYELKINGSAIKVNGGNKFFLTDNIRVAGVNPEPITSIELHMVCDTQNECDITHEYSGGNTGLAPIGECQADGTVKFTFTPANVRIVSAVFDGVVKTSNFVFTGKQPNVEYDYTVTYEDGCVLIGKAKVDNCCTAPEIECTDDGKYQISYTSGTVTYTLGSSNINVPNGGKINPPTTGEGVLTHICGGVTKTYSILPFASNNECCNIAPIVDKSQASSGIITVGLPTGAFPETFKITLGNQSVPGIGAGEEHEFTGVPEGSVLLVIESEEIAACKYQESITVPPDDCDVNLEVVVDSDNCKIIATTDEKDCDCPMGRLSGGTSTTPTSAAGNNINFSYTFTREIDDSEDVGLTSGTIKVYSGSSIVQTLGLNDNATSPSTAVTVSKTCETNSTNVTFNAKSEACEGGCGGKTHAVTVYVPQTYKLVSVQSGTQTVSAANNAPGEYYVYINLPNILSTVTLNFESISDSNTTGSFTGPLGALGPHSFSAVTSNCSECASVRFLYEITLEDGCSYKQDITKQVCVGQNTTFAEDLNLTKVQSIREMEFVFLKDDVQIRRDFESDFEMTYTKAEVDFEPGSVYTVKAICGCTEQVEVEECFETGLSLEADPSSCNRIFDLDISSCYINTAGSAKLGNDIKSFITDSNGDASVKFTLTSPIITPTADVEVSYGSECVTTYSIDADQPDIAWTTQCSEDLSSYAVTFTAEIDGEPVAVLVTGIPSGAQYGTISTNSITGITTEAAFQVQLQLNGITGCSYFRTIQLKCDCNITSASVTGSDSICVINGVVQSSPSLTFSVGRIDTNKQWRVETVSGTVLVNNTASNSGQKTITTSLAPNSGENTVNVEFIDVDSGDVCATESITIYRSNLTYTATVNPCSEGTWSVTTYGGTVSNIVSTPASSLSSLSSIPDTITSVSFRISNGDCSVNLTKIRPTGCHECSSNNLQIGTRGVHTAPCEVNDIEAVVHVYGVISSDNQCPISTVTVGGVTATLSTDGGGRWVATLPADSVGSKTIIATDACGCTKTATVQITQNCCAELHDASVDYSPSSIQVGQSTTITVNGASGYDITFGNATGVGGAVNVSSSGSGNQKTYTLDLNPGGVTSFTVPVTIGTGGTTCFSTSVSITINNPGPGDPCLGFGCPACRGCIVLPDGSPTCVDNIQNGTSCGGDNICCGGSCQAACEEAESYVDDCILYNSVCISDCSAPYNQPSVCFSMPDVTIYGICGNDNCYIPAFTYTISLLPGNPCGFESSSFSIVPAFDSAPGLTYTTDLVGDDVVFTVEEQLFCTYNSPPSGGMSNRTWSVIHSCGQAAYFGTIVFNSSSVCGFGCTACGE